MRIRPAFVSLVLIAAAALAGEALAWGPANHARITDHTADTLGYTKTVHMHWAFVHYDRKDKTLTDIMKSGGILADINKTLVKSDATGWLTIAGGRRISNATKALLDGSDQEAPWADAVRKVALAQFRTQQTQYIFCQGWISHYLADDVEHHHYPSSRAVVKTILGHAISKLAIAEAFANDTDGGAMPASLTVSHEVWHAVLAEMAAQTGNQELLLFQDADLDQALRDFTTTYIDQLRLAWVVRMFARVGALPFDHAEYDGLYQRSVDEQLTNSRGEGLFDARGAGPLPAFP